MTVRMVKVSELLKKLTCSCDGFDLVHATEWLHMMADKALDPQFPVLVDAIMENGFTDPIGVYVYSDGRWEMGNGHHRLTAAILLGLDEIPADIGNPWPDSGMQNSDRITAGVTPEYKAESKWISAFICKSESTMFDNSSALVDPRFREHYNSVRAAALMPDLVLV